VGLGRIFDRQLVQPELPGGREEFLLGRLAEGNPGELAGLAADLANLSQRGGRGPATTDVDGAIDERRSIIRRSSAHGR